MVVEYVWYLSLPSVWNLCRVLVLMYLSIHRYVYTYKHLYIYIYIYTVYIYIYTHIQLITIVSIGPHIYIYIYVWYMHVIFPYIIKHCCCSNKGVDVELVRWALNLPPEAPFCLCGTEFLSVAPRQLQYH